MRFVARGIVIISISILREDTSRRVSQFFSSSSSFSGSGRSNCETTADEGEARNRRFFVLCLKEGEEKKQRSFFFFLGFHINPKLHILRTSFLSTKPKSTKKRFAPPHTATRDGQRHDKATTAFIYRERTKRES